MQEEQATHYPNIRKYLKCAKVGVKFEKWLRSSLSGNKLSDKASFFNLRASRDQAILNVFYISCVVNILLILQGIFINQSVVNSA